MIVLSKNNAVKRNLGRLAFGSDTAEVKQSLQAINQARQWNIIERTALLLDVGETSCTWCGTFVRFSNNSVIFTIQKQRQSIFLILQNVQQQYYLLQILLDLIDLILKLLKIQVVIQVFSS
ncbi:hypothetical protein [Brevinema andersonii]|uniref:hypothetical protein n=1 Tax=Brevinema andersonii TaxID=34097 RepID=UPI000B860020|nr:hypothetical protein [Brevinema andersonii]